MGVCHAQVDAAVYPPRIAPSSLTQPLAMSLPVCLTLTLTPSSAVPWNIPMRRIVIKRRPTVLLGYSVTIQDIRLGRPKLQPIHASRQLSKQYPGTGGLDKDVACLTTGWLHGITA